jgi:kynurenine formamidase
MSGPRIVDLSYTLTSEMLVYPGTERPSFRWVGRVNSEGYNLTRMTTLVHCGTHVDAPTHFVDGTTWIDAIAPDRFFGTCRLWRCPADPQGQTITLAEVQEGGFQLAQGDIFVLATGIEAYSEKKEYNARYPCPAEDLVRWLISRRIRAYMTDATAVDPVGSADSPIHRLILGAGIPIVENLRNLAHLPQDRPFVICALPLKLGGREGAPCRAVALPDIERLPAPPPDSAGAIP